MKSITDLVLEDKLEMMRRRREAMDEADRCMAAGGGAAERAWHLPWAERTDLPRVHARRVGTETGERWLAALAILREKVAAGAQVAVIGACGGGKTQMLVNLCRYAEQNGKTREYIPIPELLVEIRASYSPRSQATEQDILKRLSSVHLLCLDEESARKGDDRAWDGIFFRALIDRRYRQGRATVIASNAADDEAFARGVGPAVWDRIRETGGVIRADWGSFR